MVQWCETDSIRNLIRPFPMLNRDNMCSIEQIQLNSTHGTSMIINGNDIFPEASISNFSLNFLHYSFSWTSGDIYDALRAWVDSYAAKRMEVGRTFYGMKFLQLLNVSCQEIGTKRDCQFAFSTGVGCESILPGGNKCVDANLHRRRPPAHTYSVHGCIETAEHLMCLAPTKYEGLGPFFLTKPVYPSNLNSKFSRITRNAPVRKVPEIGEHNLTLHITKDRKFGGMPSRKNNRVPSATLNGSQESIN